MDMGDAGEEAELADANVSFWVRVLLLKTFRKLWRRRVINHQLVLYHADYWSGRSIIQPMCSLQYMYSVYRRYTTETTTSEEERSCCCPSLNDKQNCRFCINPVGLKITTMIVVTSLLAVVSSSFAFSVDPVLSGVNNGALRRCCGFGDGRLQERLLQNSSVYYGRTTRIKQLQLSKLDDEEEHTCNHDERIQHGKRRSLLKSAIAASSFITTIISNDSSHPNYAFAADEDLLEIDQKKVVMSVSHKNIPQKYGGRISEVEETTDDSSWFTDIETRRINVFEKAAPSVVFIDTYVELRDAFSTNVYVSFFIYFVCHFLLMLFINEEHALIFFICFFECLHYFRMEVPIGTGSGFVWDDKGHIVTNYHVVRNAKSAQIAILSQKFDDDEVVPSKKIAPSKQQRILTSSSPTPLSQNPIRSTTMRNDAGVANYSRKVYKAKVVGVDPGKDIAVLKVDAPVFDLYPIDVGTSTGLKVGQSAYAIGNPFGLDHTLTVGVVSGIGREVKSPIGRPITKYVV
jgi:S1-C subfamily serine protease